MTRKDFILIANALAKSPNSPEKEVIVSNLIDALRQTNDAFDTRRFQEACFLVKEVA